MKLFPAIDILGGRAVRLLYGKRDKITDYGAPLERALLWKEYGAKNLHIVDLDGAFEGEAISNKYIGEIVKKTGLFVQSGGGLRTIDDIKKRLDLGVDRVILGTMAYENPTLFEQVVNLFGKKIVAGIDAIDGFVAIKGWTDKTNIKAIDFALHMKKLGICTIVFTDISKDGALTGVNVESTKEISDKTGLDIIASGGVSSLNDLVKLKENEIYGAILGRAIYTGNIDLKQAVSEI
jgi:phosphoribosylformimino-5-aminoimidazole carboxamide ribotide isomerase